MYHVPTIYGFNKPVGTSRHSKTASWDVALWQVLQGTDDTEMLSNAWELGRWDCVENLLPLFYQLYTALFMCFLQCFFSVHGFSAMSE